MPKMRNISLRQPGTGSTELWINTSIRAFGLIGNLWKKYNLVDTGIKAGCGGYPLQEDWVDKRSCGLLYLISIILISYNINLK